MAVINNPPAVQQTDSNSATTLMMFVLILILAILFIFYGLPYLRSSMGGAGTSAPQINVPRNIDVNINK